jgi:hypothetical protein
MLYERITNKKVYILLHLLIIFWLDAFKKRSQVSFDVE